MSDIEIPVAEPVELTPEQARELTDQIRAGVTNLLPIIKRAFEGRADRAMGYDSWNAYCDAELRGIRVPVAIEDRRAAVAELRESGMSTRAIGAALGVSHMTAQRDLDSSGTSVTDGSTASTVASLDGRERPASRPTPPPEASAEPTVEGAEPTAPTAVEQPAERQVPERPGADRGRAAVQQVVDEERQKGEYLRNFHAALTKSGSAWSYDAERVGREASPETFTAIEANVSAAVHWLATARKARSGLRVINGGAS